MGRMEFTRAAVKGKNIRLIHPQKLHVIPKSDAVKQYSDLVDTLVGGESDMPTAEAALPTNEDILVQTEGGVQTVTLNRPSKFNAITVQVKSGSHSMETSV